MKWAFGVDIGGTKIDIGAVDDKGNVLQKKRIPTEAQNGPDIIIKNIIKEIEDLKKGINSSPIGVGVGIAGQINLETGAVIFAPNLKWHNIPLQEELKKSLNLPVIVTNDVRAITWGEWIYGSGKGCKNFVCMFIGTGIGSGIVSEGKILSGSNNTAGEVGHMTIDMNGPNCTCGNWGCMETYAAGWGIARQAEKALLLENDGQILEKIIEEKNGEISARAVIEAYRRDDPVATKVIQEAIQALIAGSASIVNAFNPERLILGGGIVEGLPEIIQEVNLGVRERALPAATEYLQVVKAEMLHDAGVIGCATMALQTFAKIENFLR